MFWSVNTSNRVMALPDKAEVVTAGSTVCIREQTTIAVHRRAVRTEAVDIDCVRTVVSWIVECVAVTNDE